MITWGDCFQDPDDVGSSEYRAIHDVICEAVLGVDGFAVEREQELALDELKHIEGSLEEIRDNATSLRRDIRQKRLDDSK